MAGRAYILWAIHLCDQNIFLVANEECKRYKLGSEKVYPKIRKIFACFPKSEYRNHETNTNKEGKEVFLGDLMFQII